MKEELFRFLRYARMGYLVFTSFLILAAFFGAFEIFDYMFLSNASVQLVRWLYFSRGVVSSLLLMIWAAWTVYNYRGLYEERLEFAKGRFRDIVEHSADAIISVNREGEITSWNRGAEEIFGWDRNEVIGEPVEMLIPDDLMKQQELEHLEEGMRKQGYVRNHETERLNRKGQKVLVNLTESYIRDEDGKIVGRSMIMRDLTELKIREEQVQQSERLATVGHMAAGVAHEVGNPLTAISSLVQLCQRKTDDPFIQEQMKKVRDHIHRITKIVRDLVDFSRPSSLQSEETQINRVVTSAVGLLKHDARCRDVDFDLDLSPRLPKIVCVPDQIHQVIVNLLLNAVDSMKGIQDPKIRIRTSRNHNGITLSVADRGKGIEEEHRPHIFEPFYTTKGVGKGTGLGLSVSHGIITKLGGRINVNSEVGEGTEFTIHLPLNS